MVAAEGADSVAATPTAVLTVEAEAAMAETVAAECPVAGRAEQADSEVLLVVG